MLPIMNDPVSTVMTDFLSASTAQTLKDKLIDHRNWLDKDSDSC